MIANHAIENSSYCNPELGSVSHLTDQTTSESAPYIAEPCNPNDAALSTTSAVSENTIVSACPENDVEPVPSLCHSTTGKLYSIFISYFHQIYNQIFDSKHQSSERRKRACGVWHV